jgi:hypothetical protein
VALRLIVVRRPHRGRTEIKEMHMFRTATTTTTALAVLALGTTGTAVAANVDASAHAEAHAVIDSAKALRMARAGADRAKAYVQSSEDSLGRAYQATASQSRQSSAKGLQATADFSAAAHAQSR